MQKVSRIFSYFILATFGFLAVINSSTIAPTVSAAPCEPGGSILGIPTWYKYLDGEDVAGKCRPIIEASKDSLPIGLALFEAALTIAGLVAVSMIFIGSFKYILTLGEPEKATAARKTIINALIGLVLTLLSARIVSFIAGRIG